MSVNLNLNMRAFDAHRALPENRLELTIAVAANEDRPDALRRTASWVLSASVFCASAALVRILQRELPGSDPQVLLMLAPILEIGVRHGRAAATGAWLASLAVSLAALLPHPADALHLACANDALSLALLTLAGPFVASIAGRWRESRRELAWSEERRLAFSQEVLLAATSGRLRLCDSGELRDAAPGPASVQYPLRCLDDVALVRSRVRIALEARGTTFARIDDLMMCVTEAATNALKHGGGGSLSIWISEDKISALVSDRGAGISPINLARATLEAGYSTQGTLGMGFTLMLAMSDTLRLATSPQGTEVLIEIGRRANS